MKHRTIEIQGCDTCKEVLLQVVRNDAIDDFVQISAWHNNDDGDLLQESMIQFTGFKNHSLSLERFIADFSEVSANEFSNSYEF